MDLLTSAVVAAIVSGLVAILTAERRIAAENVIQERKEWREKVRDLVSKVCQAAAKKDKGTAELQDQGTAELEELRAKFSLRLNPFDQEDREILSLIVPGSNVKELTERVSLLLKHDWERAKYEANLYRRLWEEPPKRVAFRDYERGREMTKKARGKITFGLGVFLVLIGLAGVGFAWISRDLLPIVGATMLGFIVGIQVGFFTQEAKKWTRSAMIATVGMLAGAGTLAILRFGGPDPHYAWFYPMGLVIGYGFGTIWEVIDPP